MMTRSLHDQCVNLGTSGWVCKADSSSRIAKSISALGHSLARQLRRTHRRPSEVGKRQQPWQNPRTQGVDRPHRGLNHNRSKQWLSYHVTQWRNNANQATSHKSTRCGYHRFPWLQSSESTFHQLGIFHEGPTCDHAKRKQGAVRQVRMTSESRWACAHWDDRQGSNSAAHSTQKCKNVRLAELATLTPIVRTGGRQPRRTARNRGRIIYELQATKYSAVKFLQSAELQVSQF